MNAETFWEHFATFAEAPNGIARIRTMVYELAFTGRLSSRTDLRGAAELPEGWTEKAISEVIEFARPGFACNKNNQVEGGHVHLRTHNISTEGRLNFDLVIRIEPSMVDPDRGSLRKGDVIFNNTNSQELVGKTCLVDRDYDYGFSNHLTQIRLLAGYLPDYFVRHVNLLWRRGDFARLCNRWIGQAGINTKALKEIRLRFPPLAEQRRIVEKVDQLLGLCDELATRQAAQREKRQRLVGATLDRLVSTRNPAEFPTHAHRLRNHFDQLFDTPTTIPQLRQTILQLAVHGKLVPQDSNDEPPALIHSNDSSVSIEAVPFTAPTCWRWFQVSEVFEVSGGITKNPKRTPVKNHFPYLRVANVQRGRLKLDEIERFELADGELERWRLESRDILVVEGNGSEDEIGRCALWNGEIADCVHQNHIIRCRPLIKGIQDFVLLFLNSPAGIAEMKERAITTSGLYSLSVGKIRSLAIPLPPLAEQKRIVTKVTELLSLCDALEAKLTQAESASTQLLSAAVHHLLTHTQHPIVRSQNDVAI